MENAFLNLLAHGVLFWNLRYEFRKRKKTAFLNLGFLGIEGMIWLYLGYQNRLPARVGAALLCFVFLAAWSVFYKEQCREEPQEWKKSLVNGILFLFLAGIAVGKWSVIQRNQKTYYQENQAREELEDYFRAHSTNVYFTPSYVLSDFVANFRLLQSFSISNGLSLGGWSAFSPLRTEGMEYYGIFDADRAIIEQDNVYLVLPVLSTKIEEHYRQSYKTVIWKEYETVQMGDRQVCIFQIRVKESLM